MDSKKRTANFTNNEKEVLIELVNKYKDVVECKRSDSTTNAHKAAGWARLAKEFNSISAECYRSANNLKTCWENIKRIQKKEVTVRRNEMFKTGGGPPHKPSTNNNASIVVEAVLGPALEGLCNKYDSNALINVDDNQNSPDTDQVPSTSQVYNIPSTSQVYNIPSTSQVYNIPSTSQVYNIPSTSQICNIPSTSRVHGVPNYSQVSDCKAKRTESYNDITIITGTEEEKENCSQAKETFVTKSGDTKNPMIMKEDLWESWTPKSLKRPLAEPLRTNNSENEWIKRRRPREDCSADAFMREKMELVKMMKKNVEEEGNLRLLILKEQLKQEKIKTDKLMNS